MSTILVPLDYSDCAASVFDEALRFATAFGASMVLLHVSEVTRGLPLSVTVQPPDGGAPKAVEAVLRDDVEAHLAPLAAEARRRGIEAVTRVAFGRPAQMVLDAARREGATLIVMGTHGRTGLARLALGSVAEEVIRQADAPVVTVRTRHHPGWAARSCATCTAARSPVELRLSAEESG